MKILSRPSASAWRRTWSEPGTTIEHGASLLSVDERDIVAVPGVQHGAIASGKHLNPADVEATAVVDSRCADGEIVEAVREQASVPQAMQVVRDLTVVARAEGEITDNELLVLFGVADGLGIPRSLVLRILDGDTELD